MSGPRRRLAAIVVLGAAWVLVGAPTGFLLGPATDASASGAGSASTASGASAPGAVPASTASGEVLGGSASGAGLASTASGEVLANDSSSPLPCLAPIVAALRADCGREDLRISWALSGSVAARLAAHPDATAEQVEGGGCSDRVVVQVSVGGGGSRYLLSGDVEIFGAGLRAVRTLKAGAIVAPEDVAWSEDWFPPSAVDEEALSAEGAYVRRSVPAGHTISAADLGPAPLVRRGETVRVVYRARGLELRTLGTARRDGWMGDRLAVRAEGAQHDCAGIVAGPDMVEVDSEGSRR